MKFLLANWDCVLIVLAFAGALIVLAVKKRWDLLGKILFGLVTWAEREFGSGTGSLKLAAVTEKLYPHIPAVIRLFISAAQLEHMIEQALADAKLKWSGNPKLVDGAEGKQ
jgi:hypothetical protein